MALLKHSNQQFFKLSDENHSRSKAQMSLKKIIEVISIGHSVESCSLKQKLESGMKVKDCIQRGIGIDLNLRLGPTTESEIQKIGLSACSAVGEEGGDGRGGCAGICSSTVVVVGGGEFDKSSEGECDPKQVTDQKRRGGEKEEGGDEEDARELSSEITEIGKKPIGMGEENKEVESEEKREENQEQKAATKVEEEPKKLLSTETKNDGNYLSLLVEAAKLVSGGFEDEDEDKTEEQQEEKSKGKRVRINDDEEEEEEEEKAKAKKSRGKKEDRELEKEMELNYEAFEDISPVVRSKRGRNQVLPHRYRDSVLEPWKRLSSRVSAKQRNNK